MQRLEWSALIQPTQSPASTQEAACNHGKVVTGPLVATQQAIDYKEETAPCNHVTTKNTEIEEIRPHHAEEKAEHLPGGDWCGNDRAGSETGEATVCRPVLHYRLRDVRNGSGSLIGEPGEALSSLLHVLVQHYGNRLDVESVREAFEERAAIIEFDAGLPRTDAERSAASALAGVNGSFLRDLEQG